MVKLIFVADTLSSGGAERVMSVLAKSFAETGYDTTILLNTAGPSFYNLGEKVKLVHTPAQINHKNRATVAVSRFGIYSDIFRYLKTEKPDLVITFSTTTNGPVILICKLLGLRVIASEHSNYRVRLNSLQVWLIKRLIYPRADLLTVLTERDCNEYYSKFMNNIVVMRNPLAMKPAETVNSDREEVILAIGFVSPCKLRIKGLDTLLEVYQKIAAKFPNWRLVIAGGGDPGSLNKIIGEYGLSSYVSLIGEIKDVQPLMEHSSIFALTSRWEGLPMTIIEAMSQGMACIAFDCFTGPGDIITDNCDGILVEDQNTDQFIEKLSRLIENKNLRLELGRNAIETSKKYLPEVILPEWYKLIERYTA